MALPRPALAEKLARSSEVRAVLEPGTSVLVALSGGLDSVALLHLLRFHAPVHGLRVRAAHLDHAIRRGSDRDADWVRGLCRAWRVPLDEWRLTAGPASEAEARRLRYAFLQERRGRLGAGALIATAHHADDQAETVLFRALRGTGVHGLSGILPVTGSGVVRPFLTLWREEIERYAHEAGLSWREDESNHRLVYARNAIRHRFLPGLEEGVAPGARRALARLARIAREEDRAMTWLIDSLSRAWVVESATERIALDRTAFLEAPAGVRARVLRRIAERLGVTLSERRTRAALELAGESQSGRWLDLGDSLRLERSFDRLWLSVGDPEPSAVAHATPLPIDSWGPGEALLTWPRGHSRVRYRVRWAPTGEWDQVFAAAAGQPPSRSRWSLSCDTDPLDGPLRLRSWRPGDRIELPAGSRKLKRVFGDRRVPTHRRRHLPLLVDVEDRVLWVPGVARSRSIQGGGETWTLDIEEQHD